MHLVNDEQLQHTRPGWSIFQILRLLWLVNICWSFNGLDIITVPPGENASCERARSTEGRVIYIICYSMLSIYSVIGLL
jgi:hypothetical protein